MKECNKIEVVAANELAVTSGTSSYAARIHSTDREEAPNDRALVEQLKAGNEEALLEVLNRYSEKVHNLAMRISRSQEDTEEIMQDVFHTVFRKIHNFEVKSGFSSWLYRITVNSAFMKLRKRRQHSAISLEEITPGVKESWVSERREDSDANFMSSRHELRAHLEAAITRLPEEYRMIFILRDVDGLSNQEVGEVLGISVPAVKSRLHRSRLLLRKKLQRFFNDYQSDEIPSDEALELLAA